MDFFWQHRQFPLELPRPSPAKRLCSAGFGINSSGWYFRANWWGRGEAKIPGDSWGNARKHLGTPGQHQWACSSDVRGGARTSVCHREGRKHAAIITIQPCPTQVEVFDTPSLFMPPFFVPGENCTCLLQVRTQAKLSLNMLCFCEIRRRVCCGSKVLVGACVNRFYCQLLKGLSHLKPTEFPNVWSCLTLCWELVQNFMSGCI